MSINIKNPRVHELARRAAELTGQSQVGAIETALTRLIDELEDSRGEDARRGRVYRILAEIDGRLSDADRQAMTTDDFYDDAGLPR